MTLDQFIAKYTGHYVDYDHTYGNQCMDLANQYVTEVLKLPPLAGNAINTLRPTPGFTMVLNEPANAPAPGDVVVWKGPNATVGTTIYGHIGIGVDATPQSFRSFDQNWPELSAPHIQGHSYVAVLGWLHPRVSPVPPQAPPKPGVYKASVARGRIVYQEASTRSRQLGVATGAPLPIDIQGDAFPWWRIKMLNGETGYVSSLPGDKALLS